MNSFRKLLIIVFPWLAGLLFFIFLYKSPFVIWPSGIRKGFYSDSVTQDKGNSGIRSLNSPEGSLAFEYTLGDKYEFPYVGATFELESDTLQRISDLSGYDFLEIEIEADLSKRIPVVINQDIKNYSVQSDGASFRPMTKELLYEKGKRGYSLKLSDFQTPSWWFTLRNITEKEAGRPDFSRSHSVQIHNCQVLPRNVKEVFTIYRIAFYKDLTSFWYWCLILIPAYYILVLVAVKFRGKVRKILPRKELHVENVADEESRKVMKYIGENYNNPELSLEVMQKELGLSEARISGAIKSVSEMNFKKYLNTIRLEEAKRLLTKTDRPVMDIAYRVGYGNVTHFNRVFKETEGCSPNEFRKLTSEKA